MLNQIRKKIYVSNRRRTTQLMRSLIQGYFYIMCRQQKINFDAHMLVFRFSRVFGDAFCVHPICSYSLLGWSHSEKMWFDRLFVVCIFWNSVELEYLKRDAPCRWKLYLISYRLAPLSHLASCRGGGGNFHSKLSLCCRSKPNTQPTIYNDSQPKSAVVCQNCEMKMTKELKWIWEGKKKKRKSHRVK